MIGYLKIFDESECLKPAQGTIMEKNILHKVGSN